MTEMFEKAFPQYIFYGMSYDQYWYGDPNMVKAYRESHDLAIKARNQELWLQGLYNYNAIATALSNIHLDGKTHKINKYLDKPFELFEKSEEEKKVDVKATRQKVINSLNRWKQLWDKKGKPNG